MKKETYEDFEFQLQQQQQQQEQQNKRKTKIDEDGYEMEWDDVKKAWFPVYTADLELKFKSAYEQQGTSSKDNESSEKEQKQQTYYDPKSKTKYVWDTTVNNWVVAPSDNPYEYTDTATGTKYYWNFEDNKWGTEKVSVHNFTDQSGKTYNWDQERYLWVAEDGTTLQPSQSADSNQKKKAEKRKHTGLKSIGGKKSKAEWFQLDKEKNTSVYVKGLPEDITLEEFTEMMQKYGIIATNPVTSKLKIKLYRDKEGNVKGDGLCNYLKRESLELVMNLLNGTMLRKSKISVEQAKFEIKGNYDPSKKPKMLTKKEKEKIKKQENKRLNWHAGSTEEAKSSKSERVVIFSNLFQPADFNEDALLITRIQQRLREECEKIGEVKKVIVFDNHPDGVCSVAFKQVEQAKACIQQMNNRLFMSKLVKLKHWDGVTDYKVEETALEREERLNKWHEHIMSED